MDVKNEVVYKQDLFVGRVRGINASPYQIVQSAILMNATHIILAHNHPSQEDIKFSENLKEVLSHFNIILLNHLIVLSSSYYWTEFEKFLDSLPTKDAVKLVTIIRKIETYGLLVAERQN
ncbi:hypothetical protein C7M50_01396 [Pediococcus pentosaceus]|nr:hypothetical protein C7M48_00567 [Pediococcus pentosaceus]QHM66554.1 hypothetical protein C7M49_00480 [Pediococcus pentosaceus]QHM69292.1 hypothetical protein C7M50_01396 [Pediococcus pentosaceus]